jgi:hypothetical protein
MKGSAGNLAWGARLQFYESSLRKKVSRRAIAAKNNIIHTGIIITHAKDTTVLNASSLIPWKTGKLGTW